MKKLAALLASLVLALVTAGCGGGKGSPADYPKDFKVTAGDTAVVITWTAEPEVEYWLFYGRGTNITTTNWVSQGGSAIAKVTSPYVLTRLTNGQVYSFTINGRKDGGPGGDGAPTQVATPQLAGGNWSAGEPMGTGNLNGAASGAGGAALNTYLTMVVGDGGTIYSRNVLGTTTTPTNPSAPARLNAVAFGTAGWIAVGDGGASVGSVDGETWTAKPTSVTANLYGISPSPLGGYIATGAAGTILLGSTAATWSPATSPGTTNDLRAALYGNARYVAVGAAGTVVTGTDGLTWTVSPSGTTADLRGLAYAGLATTTDGVTTTVYHYVAVGKGGTVLHSNDALTWTTVAPFTTKDLNAVIYGGQFVAVGSGGGIFTSPDGLTWTARNSGTTADLNAIARTQAGYSVVGTGGTIVSSF